MVDQMSVLQARLKELGPALAPQPCPRQLGGKMCGVNSLQLLCSTSEQKDAVDDLVTAARTRWIRANAAACKDPEVALFGEYNATDNSFDITRAEVSFHAGIALHLVLTRARFPVSQ